MKKLLLISLLLLALVFTVVACTEDTPDTTDTTVAETTGTEEPTVAPTEAEDTTAAEDPSEDTTAAPAEETTAPAEETTAAPAEETTVPEEKPTEPEETTEAPETLPATPEAGTATQVKPSWDSIFKNEENNLAQADGGAADKFTAAPIKLDDTWHTIMFRGWAGSGDAENKFVTFGYRIDLGDLVAVDGSLREAEQGVIDAGGDARYVIPVPTEPLKGGFHYIRGYGICADGTAIEILNIWIEGRDLTALEAAQAWDIDKSVLTHLSFDELRDGGAGIFAPGAAAGWDGIAKINESVTTLQFWGWVGIVADTIGTFGYSIDGAEPIFNAAWNVEAEGPVVDAAAGTGAASATRMLIDIPVAGMYGEHTVTVYYMAADGSAACILKEFTVAGTEILDAGSAGLVKNNFDSQGSDNYSSSIAGWLGFGQPVAKLGFSVDSRNIVWLESGINYNPEDAVKGLAGEHAIRYGIQADLSTVPFGEHTVYFYVRLEDGSVVEFHSTTATTSDPSFVGDSDYDFDSAVTPDLGTFFNFGAGLSADQCAYNAGPYRMAGINQLIKTTNGTFKMTLTNLKSSNGQAVVFFRGNPNPTFGDANYFGHDGNNDPSNLSVGCAGIYASVITDENGNPYLRLNVKGNVDGSAAITHIYNVSMTSYDLTVVDNNDTVTFYNGDTLLATVDVNGNSKGYATEAIVTLADGTTETLTDVCCAATAASDIGFVARSCELTFDAVTVKALGN